MAKQKKKAKKAAARATVSKKASRGKKPARRPAPGKNPAAKKKGVRPAARAAKKVARKAVKKTVSSRAKASAVRRSRSAKRAAVSRKKPAAGKAARKPAAARVRPAVSAATARSKVRAMGRKELEQFRKALLDLRDRVIDRITFLAGENLNHSQREASGDLSNYGIHMADQGTDNFDREFALSMVSNEQEALNEIDEALTRIEGGSYAICEDTGRPIETERLKVIPYARYCLAAQEEREKGRKHFRAFAVGSAQGPMSQNG